MIKTSEDGCVGVGGYGQKYAQPDEEAMDRVFHVKFKMNDGVAQSVQYFQAKALNSGPVAHNQLLNTPIDTCKIVAGGTQERWAILSPATVPGSPCDLDLKSQCKFKLNEDTGDDLVNWIACDGFCKRWLHTLCINMTKEEYDQAMKKKKWLCGRPDCKKSS